jgi:hypothetical protein
MLLVIEADPELFWTFCPGCGLKHRVRKPQVKGWLYCGPCAYYLTREEYFAPVPEGVELRKFP